MTSCSNATVIALSGSLARREPQGGHFAPSKANAAARGPLRATASRQGVPSRLDGVASSVTMHLHRSAPSFLPADKSRLVTAVLEQEVMS